MHFSPNSNKTIHTSILRPSSMRSIVQQHEKYYFAYKNAYPYSNLFLENKNLRVFYSNIEFDKTKPYYCSDICLVAQSTSKECDDEGHIWCQHQEDKYILCPFCDCTKRDSKYSKPTPTSVFIDHETTIKLNLEEPVFYKEGNNEYEQHMLKAHGITKATTFCDEDGYELVADEDEELSDEMKTVLKTYKESLKPKKNTIQIHLKAKPSRAKKGPFLKAHL